MELKQIDKVAYKKRLNQVQFGAVGALFVLGMGLAEMYRAIWADGESSTWLNAAGVLTAVAILAGVFKLIRDKPWMADIRYTWKLKQELNRIYRHVKFVEAGVADNDPDALKIHYFSLHGSKHLYEIEDNTLTVPEIIEKIAALDQQLAELELTVSITDYEPWLLEVVKKSYKSSSDKA